MDNRQAVYVSWTQVPQECLCQVNLPVAESSFYRHRHQTILIEATPLNQNAYGIKTCLSCGELRWIPSCVGGPWVIWSSGPLVEKFLSYVTCPAFRHGARLHTRLYTCKLEGWEASWGVCACAHSKCQHDNMSAWNQCRPFVSHPRV